jgi:hypothetical protein
MARGWENDWNIKDLLLNITEEGCEFWNLIKWINEEKQKEVVNNHKEQVLDYIGDIYSYCLKSQIKQMLMQARH